MKKTVKSTFLAALMILSSCKNISERSDTAEKYVFTAIEMTENITAVSPAETISETTGLQSDATEEAADISKDQPQTDITEAEVDSATDYQEPETGTVSIAFAGDVTQSDVFGDITDYCGLSYCLKDVADIFSAADIAFVNLETSVSERGVSEKKEGYGFRTAPDKLEIFTLAGIDIVSTANNHVRDFGMDALNDTFENIEKYGLDYVGAGKDLETAEKLVVYDVNGLKIGFTACNCFIENPNWFATDETAGINCIEIGSPGADAYLEKIAEYDKICDVLFVSVHWGLEYFHDATYEQKQFAHQLCDSGADIILGHHPHVLEPIENYNGKIIFYSLGNFLFYKMDDDAGKTAIFTVNVDKNGFIDGKMQPVFIEDRKSYLLGRNSEMYSEIIELVDNISDSYGVNVDNDGNIILK